MGSRPMSPPSHRGAARSHHGQGLAHGRPPAPSHRAVRPRYGRIVSAFTSLGVTSVAVLGALGALPDHAGGEVLAGARSPDQGAVRLSDYSGAAPETGHEGGETSLVTSGPPAGVAAGPETLPVDSGSGRRVVFEISSQRVWLVDEDDEVRRTYLVSGSVTDNLAPGSYEVYSTSRHAVGVDDSGTMEYMVRFAHGKSAPIGFHDIPVDDGELVQSREQLGTPQSHGCVRQWRPDAQALWDFAPVGTEVVVTA